MTGSIYLLDWNRNKFGCRILLYVSQRVNEDMLTITSRLQAAGTKKIKGTDGKGRPKKTAAVV